MKSFFVSAFILIVFTANATTYFLSANGNDADKGTSILTSWKTLNKLNSVFSTLNPGDNVLFKRGDVFSGSLIISRSGLPGSPITIGAYGKGANPVITGFTTVGAWTALKNNIWESASVVSTLATCNMVVINGVNTPMGRYPNTGWLTYTTPTSSSVSCASLSPAVNWTGAEAVIRKNDYHLDRCLITGQSGNTITYSNLGSGNTGKNNYGLFIQNDARTLDAQNEWYYNPSTKKIQIFSKPAPAKVQVAIVTNLVSNAGFDFITINSINFTGANSDALSFATTSNNITIQNCSINFTGGNGITMTGNNDLLDNNTISNTAGTGIFKGGAGGTVITNNTITNAGVIAGESFSENQNRGIHIFENPGPLVQYNTIKNTGFHGISMSSNVSGIQILNNFVDSAVVLLNDGGGIYTGGASSGRMINGNIVLNTMGNTEGTPGGNLAEGIYLDELASNITVTNNTVADCGDAGIKLHKANTNTINNNTSYNNHKVQITYQDATDGVIHDNVMKNNIFFAKTSTQYAFGGHSSNNDIPTFFSAVDSNYYMRPVDDDLVFNISQPGAKAINRNLTGWQTMIGKDTHSPKSPVAITDVNDMILEYNPTRVPLTISLPSEYIDVKNVLYKKTITLAPYSSAVLIKAGAANKRSPKANGGNSQNGSGESKTYFAAGRIIFYMTLANCGFTPLCCILANVLYYYPLKPAARVYSNLFAVLKIILKNGDFDSRSLKGI